jgi:RimJ/RimL family protein N-acetyltransferase
MQKTKSRVYLRPLAQHDLDRVLKWHNDADPYSTLRGHFRYVSREAETEWLRRRLEARDEVNVAICLSEPPQHIGNIYFAQHRLGRPKMPNYTHLLQWEHRGKGYGSTAVRLSAKHAFEDLGLMRIYLIRLGYQFLRNRRLRKVRLLKEGQLSPPRIEIRYIRGHAGHGAIQ